MAVKTIIFALISFFHNVFSVIWMGGIIVTVIAYLPAVKETHCESPQVKKVMIAFQNRQRIWVYISMAGLILTGLLMSNRNPQFQGIFHFGNPYSSILSFKHFLVIGMIGITLYRSLILRKPPANAPAQKERLNFLLLRTNAILAVLVLLLSALAAAVAQSGKGM